MKGIVIFIWMTLIISPLCAQNNEIQIQYTTEAQMNRKFNWVNLLHSQADIPVKRFGAWKNGYLNAELISIYKTAEKRIADDLQVFSNIEAGNLPLGIFALGYTHMLNKVSLFGGLRNMNRDYTTSPYASFFTHSACGLYSTLSADFPSPNYPLSAVCLHAEFRITKAVLLKSSLYNGVAYKTGGKLFRVSPKQDGLFNITQFSYTNGGKKKHGFYAAGIAVRTLPDRNKGGNEAKINYSPFVNVEQCVYGNSRKEIGFLLRAGYAPKDQNDCWLYYGAGFIAYGLFSKDKKDRMGLAVNTALYTHVSETAIELSFDYPVLKALHLQPALHYIVTGNRHSFVGMLRAVYSLNFM